VRLKEVIVLSFNFGYRAERFAMRPPEQDCPINILEGAVRSGKTWCLHPKAIYCCDYDVGGRKVITGVSKQSVYNNVLTDLFDLVGPRNYSYNRNTGQLKLCDSEWLVIGAKDEGSERYIRGLTVGVALCDEVSLMPQSFFQMLLSRMSPQGARLYGTTNPDSPYHWLKAEYLDNEELRAGRILWSDHFTMADNPNLGPRYVESQKRLYTGSFTSGSSRGCGLLLKARSTRIPGPRIFCTISKTSRLFSRTSASSVTSQSTTAPRTRWSFWTSTMTGNSIG
jgi:Phage terminase large subunit